jgi:hypothetical protein
MFTERMRAIIVAVTEQCSKSSGTIRYKLSSALSAPHAYVIFRSSKVVLIDRSHFNFNFNFNANPYMVNKANLASPLLTAS